MQIGGGEGLYDLYPETMLRTGCYRYEVTYKSTSPGSFGFPHSYVQYYNGFDGDKVTYFTETEATNSDIFWMNIDLNMTFRVMYDGTGEVSFEHFSIEELPYAAYKELLYSVLLLILANMILFGIMLREKYKITDQSKYAFFVIFAVSLIASFPMLGGYMIKGNDLDFHLVRIEGLKDALLCGQFPVRINPTFYNGYGYANPIFYGEILLYIPAFLRIIGFTLEECYLILLGIIHVMTACITYISVKNMLRSHKAAMIGTLLYTLAPYRLLDAYTRAAVGELTAMAFFPLVIYGMYRIYTCDTEQKSYRFSFVPLLVGLTGILQSHVLSGEMVAGFVLLTCIILLPKTLQKKRFLTLLKTAGLLLAINMWFLVPFVDYTLTQDLRFTALAKTTEPAFIQGTGAYLIQLMYVFFRYAWFNFNNSDIISDEMPFALGIPLIFGMLLCTAMVCCKGEKKDKRQTIIVLVLSILATWMATLYFPWDKLSTMHKLFATLISSIQFSWRFLALASALSVFATCMGLQLLEKKEGTVCAGIIAAVFCSIALIAGMHYMQQAFNGQSPYYREDTRDMDTQHAASGGEYILSRQNYDIVRDVSNPIASDGCTITDYEKQGTNITLTIENGSQDGYVTLPLLHYKGYGASSEDGKITDSNLETGEHAVIKLNIPAYYTGKIDVYFKGMWYWRVAEVFSALTIVGLFASYIQYKRKYKSCKGNP